MLCVCEKRMSDEASSKEEEATLVLYMSRRLTGLSLCCEVSSAGQDSMGEALAAASIHA